MKEFEFRILKRDGTPSLCTMWVHLSVEGAVNSAKRLARDAAFEVWSGDQCVYHSHAAAAPANDSRSEHPA